MRIAMSLIVLFAILFFTNLLGEINTWNVWVGFIMSVALSITALLLSIKAFIKQKTMLSVFGIFLSTAIILFIIFIFLLPEAGIDPAIKI
jgi:heme O synthase-like polyprenyltransferase